MGTDAFADAVIERLGLQPRMLAAVRYAAEQPKPQSEGIRYIRPRAAEKQLVGVDVFLDWQGTNPDELGESLRAAGTADLSLSMITNRGVKVWPNGMPETFCTDHWRCRFHAPVDTHTAPKKVLDLLGRLHALGFDCIKTENLYIFDGKAGYSLGQGQ